MGVTFRAFVTCSVLQLTAQNAELNTPKCHKCTKTSKVHNLPCKTYRQPNEVAFDERAVRKASSYLRLSVAINRVKNVPSH
eukprot:6192960-Pleurochrysis_carterae.AAC.1